MWEAAGAAANGCSVLWVTSLEERKTDHGTWRKRLKWTKECDKSESLKASWYLALYGNKSRNTETLDEISCVLTDGWCRSFLQAWWSGLFVGLKWPPGRRLPMRLLNKYSLLISELLLSIRVPAKPLVSLVPPLFLIRMLLGPLIDWLAQSKFMQ